jgi:DNA-binding transcriptional MerR regulator
MLQNKADNALRTIGEVAEILALPTHVIRFWETKFSKIKPVKYNCRRYYSLDDINKLKQIKDLLYVQGYSIKAADDKLKRIKISSPKLNPKSKVLEKVRIRLIEARKRLETILASSN